MIFCGDQDSMYELIGTTHNNVRTASKSASLPALRKYGAALKYYAIYQVHTSKGQFHNATDEHFLVEHHNDPYWINRERRAQEEVQA